MRYKNLAIEVDNKITSKLSNNYIIQDYRINIK